MRYGESITQSLDSLLAEDERVILLGEDIHDPYGGSFMITKGLSKKYPGRVISTPISEAGFTGIATGLALQGYRPIVEIMFSDFLTLIADQVINGMAKFPWLYGVPCPVVIRTPSGGRRGYGPTHSQSLESLFYHVPGLRIVAPSIFHDPGELLRRAVYSDKPTLFVEAKISYPKKLQELPTVEAGEVTIITYGALAQIAAEAVEKVGKSIHLDIKLDPREVWRKQGGKVLRYWAETTVWIPAAIDQEEEALVQVEDIIRDIEELLVPAMGECVL